jgi:hypothetical protein
VKRWLALVLGLSVAAAALWLLAASRGERPLGDIGSDSRSELQRVLEAADREPSRR